MAILSDSPSSPRSCYLLHKLPRELRDIIYEYALTQDKSGVQLVLAKATIKPDDDPSKHPNDKTNPICYINPSGSRDINNAFALTQTCKKVHHECGNLIYNLNTINFHVPAQGPDPSAQIQTILNLQQQRQLLKSMHISLGAFPENYKEIWCQVSGPLRALRQTGIPLRLSMQMVVYDWDFTLSDPETTQKEIETGLCEQIDRMTLVNPGRRLNFLDSARLHMNRILRTFYPVWAVPRGI